MNRLAVLVTGLGAVGLGGKILMAAKFLGSRFASWTGTLYLWRRGQKTGQKFYFVLASVLYAGSWILMILGTSWLTRRLLRVF